MPHLSDLRPIAVKVPFDRDADGQLALCLEASHNRARIIHWRDETGKAITTSVQVCCSSVLSVRWENSFENSCAYA